MQVMTMAIYVSTGNYSLNIKWMSKTYLNIFDMRMFRDI